MNTTAAAATTKKKEKEDREKLDREKEEERKVRWKGNEERGNLNFEIWNLQVGGKVFFKIFKILICTLKF